MSEDPPISLLRDNFIQPLKKIINLKNHQSRFGSQNENAIDKGQNRTSQQHFLRMTWDTSFPLEKTFSDVHLSTKLIN